MAIGDSDPIRVQSNTIEDINRALIAMQERLTGVQLTLQRGYFPFAVLGSPRLENIDRNTINSEHLTSDSVLVINSVSPSSQSGTFANLTELASLTVGTNGGEVLVIGKATIESGSSTTFNFFLRKDVITSSGIDRVTIGELTSTDFSENTALCIKHDTSPRTNQVYKFTVQRGTGTGSATIQFIQLIAIYVKQLG